MHATKPLPSISVGGLRPRRATKEPPVYNFDDDATEDDSTAKKRGKFDHKRNMGPGGRPSVISQPKVEPESDNESSSDSDDDIELN